MNTFFKFCLFILLFSIQIFSQEGTVKWEYNCGNYQTLSPILDTNGNLYLCSLDEGFFVLDSDGNKIYSSENMESYQNLLIGNNETIYIVNGYDILALNTDFTEKWSFHTNSMILSTLAQSNDGTLYFGSTNGNIYAINSDGSLKWDKTTNYVNLTSFVIGTDGSIYCISENYLLLAFNSDGNEKWSFSNQGKLLTPAIGKDGTLYVGSFNNYLYALNPDGSIKWSYFIEQGIFIPPVIDLEGSVYFVDRAKGLLNVLNNNGLLKWTFETDGIIQNQITLGSDSTIYFGSSKNILYALNPDGSTRWTFEADSSIISSPLIGDNGTLYFRTLSNTNYALSSSSKGLLASNWPTFMRNNQNTGCGELINNPKAILTQDTILVKNGEEFTLDGRSSINSNGGELSYLWRIVQQPQGSSIKLVDSTSSTINVSFTNKKYGNYLVGLTVSDNQNHKSSETITLFYNNLEWKYETGLKVVTAPVINNDNSITYFGGNGSYPDERIITLNEDGTVKWTKNVGGFVTASAAIGHDGTIFFGTNDNNLYALNQDGTEKWSYLTRGNIETSPLVGPDSLIYFGSNDKNFYCLTSDGNLKWQSPILHNLESTPALAKDGSIYFSCKNDKLYALSSDGSLKWNKGIKEFVSFSHPPTIGADGTIYYCLKYVYNRNSYNKLIALNPDGTLYWDYAFYLDSFTMPVIAADGTLYIGIFNNNFTGRLLSLNPDGTTRWVFDTERFIKTPPVIDEEGNIYFGTVDGIFYSINPQGEELFSYQTEGEISTSAAINNKGLLVFITSEGIVHALQTNTQSRGQWPEYQFNSQNTGSVPLQSLIADFTVDTTGGTLPFPAKFQDTSKGTVKSWLWDFGDGFSSRLQNPSHTFEKTDTFTVSLEISGLDNIDSMVKKKLIVVNTTTGLDDNTLLPKSFGLYQNYPNPFNPVTHISFDLPKSEFVELSIYNSNGQLVKVLLSCYKHGGHYKTHWDATNYSNGLYFVKIKAGDFLDVKKMILLK